MKDRFFYWMKFYLGFSGQEAKGFFVLVPFMLLLGLTPIFLRAYKNQSSETAFVAYQMRLDSLERMQVKLVASPLSTFNPDDTIKVSRNQKQLENLNRLPFSEADSVILQIVPGIGPGTAGRIIKYREQLGGFHSKSQLLEVYGMKEETILALWEFFEFDGAIFRKLQLNVATLEDLSAHPYVSYGEAKVLVAYRNQHGVLNSSDDLLKIKIFKAEWVQKLNPYLEFAESGR
jgi:DNA uptake protein ComE-like DNA-binding protein